MRVDWIYVVLKFHLLVASLALAISVTVSSGSVPQLLRLAPGLVASQRSGARGFEVYP